MTLSMDQPGFLTAGGDLLLREEEGRGGREREDEEEGEGKLEYSLILIFTPSNPPHRILNPLHPQFSPVRILSAASISAVQCSVYLCAAPRLVSTG